MENQNKIITPNVKSIEMKHEISITITERALLQITFLCNKISDVEWSGVLFYSTIGSISDIQNFGIKLEYIYPMDIGNAAYTEFENDESIVEFRMNNPETLKMSTGLIHSHNRMGAFFSGTDLGELYDNSEFYNVYLSVVVNNKLDAVAKLVTRAVEYDNKLEYRCKDSIGKLFKIITSQKQPTVFVYNCNINLREHYEVLDSDFTKKVEILLVKATVPKYSGYDDSVYSAGMYGASIYGSNLYGNTNKSQSNQQSKVPKSMFGEQLKLPLNFDDSSTMDIEEFISFMLQFGSALYDTIDYEEVLEEIAEKYRGTTDNQLHDYIDSMTDNFDSLVLRAYPETTNEHTIDLLKLIISYITPYAQEFLFLYYLIENLNNILKIKEKSNEQR